MLVQGMNYSLAIKEDLLVILNHKTIASNQQLILDIPLFSFFSIMLYCVSFLYSESRFPLCPI